MSTAVERFWTSERILRAGLGRTQSALEALPEAFQCAMSAWEAQRPLTLAAPTEGGAQHLGAWRQRARAWVEARLAWPRPVAPLEVRQHHRVEREGYIEERVSFLGAAPLRVPATVLVPTAGEGPFPAVLALHDMGGMRAFGREKLLAFANEPAYLSRFRQQYYEDRSILADLARRG
ncbi:MAG: hypothetical protein ACOC9Q_02420, partial [bacterium]